MSISATKQRFLSLVMLSFVATIFYSQRAINLVRQHERDHLEEKISLPERHRQDLGGANEITTNTTAEIEAFLQQYESVSRSWDVVNHTSWCHRGSRPGLIYMKLHKASSSTLSGINIRIATKVGERVLPLPPPEEEGETPINKTRRICLHTRDHGRWNLLNRRSPNLLWTFLRNPTSRAVSEWMHFEVSRKGAAQSYERTERYLRTMKNRELRYLIPTARETVKREDPFRVIQTYIMEPYDFIGLLERKWESLACMRLLWGLKVEDLIVLSAKQSGGYDDGRYHNTCFKIIKPNNISDDIQSYLSRQFPRKNHDFLLYHIVNRSLDKTIDMLGSGRVQAEAKHIRMVQEFVDARCQDEAIFPCSENGTLQRKASENDCYWEDSGCGYKCVDRVLAGNYSRFLQQNESYS